MLDEMHQEADVAEEPSGLLANPARAMEWPTADEPAPPPAPVAAGGGGGQDGHADHWVIRLGQLLCGGGRR